MKNAFEVTNCVFKLRCVPKMPYTLRAQVVHLKKKLVNMMEKVA